MKIYSMTATFGKLEHETLTLQPGLNVIHAPNEWGKSTWCAFLVAMLYGIETRVHSTKAALADKERYAPWSGSPMSGRIALCWNNRDITIERTSKGRSIMGIFRAYETQSGLPVAELSADNCGQQLLGVEKSVFTRAGFLRLSDLPVTEDKALWRRLNALVTTGDESGAADALEQKLRDLKNRCRANRANGLIPQALAQQQALQEKLQQLKTLQEQTERIRQRQDSLTEHVKKLQNHKEALEYAAAQDYAVKAAAARQHVADAQAHAAQLQQQCRDLPSANTIYQSLQQLQQLREKREALQLEVQMQPGAPEVPEAPLPFRGCKPEQALQQAAEDTRQYKQYANTKKPASTWLFILGLCITGIGIAAFAILAKKFFPIALLGVGVILSAAGLIYHNNRQRSYRDVQTAAQRLVERYLPLPAGQWESAAAEFVQKHNEYEQAMARHAQNLSHIKSDMALVMEQLNRLTGGASAVAWEQQQRDYLEQQKQLSDAIRQLRQAESVAQALVQTNSQAKLPQMPDSMTYPMAETLRLLSDAEAELRQLHLQLGRCHGQMESLGQEETLCQQLQAVESRLKELNQTYNALELAQQTAIQASAQLQRRFAPRLARRTQELFGRLTSQRYDRLTLGEDLSLMVGARQEDTLHDSLWRSDGTVDQLYLALRLAVAEELTPDAPLILDDALVRFDDNRLAAAMEILKEEAQKKQVILFTCQERETSYIS